MNWVKIFVTVLQNASSWITCALLAYAVFGLPRETFLEPINATLACTPDSRASLMIALLLLVNYAYPISVTMIGTVIRLTRRMLASMFVKTF